MAKLYYTSRVKYSPNGNRKITILLVFIIIQEPGRGCNKSGGIIGAGQTGRYQVTRTLTGFMVAFCC
jgi:hypothetical protein